MYIAFGRAGGGRQSSLYHSVGLVVVLLVLSALVSGILTSGPLGTLRSENSVRVITEDASPDRSSISRQTPSDSADSETHPGSTVSAPPPAEGGSMVYDQADGYELYFGGQNGNRWLSSTWTYQNDSWSNVTSTAGTAPAPRSGMGLTYDASDGYVLGFGGTKGYVGGPGCAQSDADCDDTWEFHAGHWTELFPTVDPACVVLEGYRTCDRFPGGPFPLTYDALDGYVVMFDGGPISGSVLGTGTETWTYHADVWTELNLTSGTPPTDEGGYGFAYDFSTSQAILFGGAGGVNSYTDTNYTWAWHAGAWRNLTSSLRLAPQPRDSFGFTFDASAGGLVMFGGRWSECTAESGTPAYCTAVAQGQSNDTWIFNASGWTNVTSGVAPSPRSGPAMADDPAAGSVLLFGGLNQENQTYTYLWDTWNWSATNHLWNPVYAPAPLSVVSLTASPTSAVFDKPVTFNSLTIGGAPPYTYAWNFGDGGTGGNLSSITHAFTTNGPFDVALTVSDTEGDVTVANLTITVLLQAAIHASNTSGASPLKVQFSGSAVGGAAPYTFAWSFGDGSPPATGSSTAHTFNGSESYTVTLTVTDAKGQQTTTSVQIDTAPTTLLAELFHSPWSWTAIGGAVAIAVVLLVVRPRGTYRKTPAVGTVEGYPDFHASYGSTEEIELLRPGESDPAEDLL
jgi:PKD repeat protein